MAIDARYLLVRRDEQSMEDTFLVCRDKQKTYIWLVGTVHSQIPLIRFRFTPSVYTRALQCWECSIQESYPTNGGRD